MDAREREMYEVLVDLSQGGTFEPAEMCGCVSVPVNFWLHPEGAWSRRPVTGSGQVDGVEYRRARCVGWVIACPRCGRKFAAGLKK
jgi:hypothetical protein